MTSDRDQIDRLLGPAGPEILCDECFERLDEYVELELSGAAADQRVPGMRAHLDGCPACADEYGSLRALVQDDAPTTGRAASPPTSATSFPAARPSQGVDRGDAR